MRIKEHVTASRMVLVPTASEQLPWISVMVVGIALVLASPFVFGTIAFLILLYILGELIGHQVIIDKAAGSITLMKRYFLLVAKQRVIPFEAAVNVDVARTWRRRWWWAPQYGSGIEHDAYVVRIHYRGKDGLQTLRTVRDLNEDSMRELAATIRGIIGGKASEKEEGLADYDENIETHPNRAYAYQSRGDFFYEIDEYDLAIADYNKAIQFDSGYAPAYHGRGLAYREKGEKARAVSDLEKCIELSADSVLTKAAKQSLSEISNFSWEG